LSSKLFEYLSVGKPIVVINPTASDQRFLRSFQGVSVLNSPGANELELRYNGHWTRAQPHR
jgi:hypothetical protein